MWRTTTRFRQPIAVKGAAALCMRGENRTDGPDKAKTRVAQMASVEEGHQKTG